MKTQKIQSIFYLRRLIDMLINRLLILFVILFSLPIFLYLYLRIYCSLCELSHNKYDVFLYQFSPKLHFVLALCLCTVLALKLLNYTALSFYGRKIFQSNNTTSKDKSFLALANIKEEATISARVTVIRILKITRIIILCLFALLIMLSWLPYIKPIVNEFKMLDTFTIKHFNGLLLILIFAASIPALAGCILLYLMKIDRQRLLNMHISQRSSYNSLTGKNLDAMTGIQFEQYCMTLFTCLGYKHMSCTKASQDQGVDLVGFKDGCKYAIQCKRYSHTVGNKAIQEVVAGMNMYSCQKAIVITTNYFTRQAKQLARVNEVALIDRIKLQQLIRSASLIKNTNINSK